MCPWTFFQVSVVVNLKETGKTLDLFSIPFVLCLSAVSPDVVSGLKVEFVLANALMATSILSLTLSKHVAAYYVTSVIYGFQRSALFTVPFIVAKNYIQEQVSQLHN